MTGGARELFDRAFPSDEGNVLALPEMHTQNSTHIFVTTFSDELAANNVKLQFLETPYWLNPVLEAHFAGPENGGIGDEELREHIYANVKASYIDDEFRDLMVDKIIAAKEAGIASIGIDVRTSEAIFWDDGIMNVIAERYKDNPDSISERQLSQLKAWELKQEFAESIRYNGVINFMSARNLPEDAIHGVVASLHVKDVDGNALVTYGCYHFSGRIDHDVQGIIDEAIEQQGLNVTSVVVAISPEDMADYDEFRGYHNALERKAGERFVNDRDDFRYVIETNELTDVEATPASERAEYEFYETGGLSLTEAFDRHRINPGYIEGFNRIVSIARLNPYELTQNHLTLADQQGNPIEPQYRVVPNENGQSITEVTGDEFPTMMTRAELLENIDLIGDINPEPLYNVTGAMSEGYLQTVSGFQDNGQTYITLDEARNHTGLINVPETQTPALALE